MKSDAKKNFIEQLKKPITQIVSVSIIGLVFIIFLFMTKVQPDFLKQTLLNQSIANLEKQRDVISQSPLPLIIDKKEVEALIIQVPTDLGISRLLLEFEGVELASGVIITDLAVGDQEIEVKDDLADYIENALKKAPAATAIPTTPLDPTGIDEPTPVPAPIVPELATPITPEIISLKITGTYDQVTNFMSQIYKMNRIINIRNWSLEPIQADQDQYAIEFGLTVYSAPKYAGTFHELPSINTEIPNKIGRPVMSNEQFRSILEAE